MDFIRFEVNGTSFLTADLSFDLSFWGRKGEGSIVQVSESVSMVEDEYGEVTADYRFAIRFRTAIS
ncbi:hypothetical protein [Ammoniphilus sp. 3BR4]|uniref:hypothetical protein n=1 Tax=Ammoniphilus sp. 3BR4 TaxID=3158265 RepID=UPI00346799EF